MSKKSVPPAFSEMAFDCPHCGVYTTHTWYEVTGTRRSRDDGPPKPLPAGAAERLASSEDIPEDQKARFISYIKKIEQGLVTLEVQDQGTYANYDIGNLHLSDCYACRKVSVWIAGRVLFPAPGQGPSPNDDLPDSVRADYDEASRILNLSPRGAAALLRLAIQKLCIALGEEGRKIDRDIASLVAKGLSPVVQKALDAVRVIGNEAVHPGSLDLKDDTATAASLFRLVNLIAEQMISNPKHVEEIYSKLPAAKREAIARRDKQTSGPGKTD